MTPFACWIHRSLRRPLFRFTLLLLGLRLLCIKQMARGREPNRFGVGQFPPPLSFPFYYDCFIMLPACRWCAASLFPPQINHHRYVRKLFEHLCLLERTSDRVLRQLPPPCFAAVPLKIDVVSAAQIYKREHARFRACFLYLFLPGNIQLRFYYTFCLQLPNNIS